MMDIDCSVNQSVADQCQMGGHTDPGSAVTVAADRLRMASPMHDWEALILMALLRPEIQANSSYGSALYFFAGNAGRETRQEAA